MTIQDWIDALLSGNYSQTKHRLRDKDGFCCLGVACDVKDSSKWVKEEHTLRFFWFFWGENGYNESHTLPDSLQKELDLDDSFLDELIYMNDNGKNFTEIAEHIKEYAEEKGLV